MNLFTKRILCLAIMSFFIIRAYSQVKVGDNAKSIHPSAALEIESKTKGFLPPRLSRDSMNLIATPAVGLVVYNTTDSSLFIKQPNGWVPLTVGKQAWVYADSNHIYNFNNSNVGIGVTNPSSKLQVDGDVRLQKGANVNEISADSTFSASSDSMLVTERAIKAYLKSGKFIGSGNVTGNNTLTEVGTSAGLTSSQLPTHDITVQGNYAYIATGDPGNLGELATVDISNPVKPVRTSGTVSTDNSAFWAVAASGDHLYAVATGGTSQGSLSVFNISNPQSMQLEGQTNDILFPVSVATQGNYVYTGNALGSFTIYDVSDPANIVKKGSANVGTSGDVYIAIKGNYLYAVSAGSALLSIYDVSDVTFPRLVTVSEAVLNNPMAITTQGDYVYVVCASPTDHSLHLFNVPDAFHILTNGSDDTNLQAPTDVAVAGGYAYVTDQNNRICVFDVHNPNTIEANGFTSGDLQSPSSLAVQGNYVYALSADNTIKTFSSSLVPVIPVASGDSLTYSTVLGDYATTASLNNYVSLTGDQTITGYKTFNNNVTVNGNLTATSLTESSDIRFKQNILPLHNALAAVMSLKGVSWLWKTDEYKYKQFSNQKQIGFVAQDVEKVVPEVVATDAQGYKSIDYAKLTAVLTEALKAQQAQIARQNTRIRSLEKQVKAIHNQTK